jgi:hypothetical protein
MPQDTPLSFSRSEFDTRLAKTRKSMAERGIELLIVTDPTNMACSPAPSLRRTPWSMVMRSSFC